MNKFIYDVPNRIKQPAVCCVNCGKSYVKKANLETDFNSPILEKSEISEEIIEVQEGRDE